MTRAPGIPAIDPASWQVTILPLPKGHTRGAAYGFCGGHPVGTAERLRSSSVGCWWPDGAAELLTLPGVKLVMAGRARGDLIPGHWSANEGERGAVRWSLRAGALTGSRLEAPRFAKHRATAAGGGVVIGVATPPRAGDARAVDVGFVWREDDALEVLSAAHDVVLEATDGTRVAGNVRGRATLWPTAAAAPLDLSPPKAMMSELRALDGETQVGTVWKGSRPRAALWRGEASSHQDLTPAGAQVASLADAAGGFQVGMVRTKENTANGTPGSDSRATIWQGDAARWLDLNALLPQDEYNASAALAIEVRGDLIRICGQASRYELQRPGTPHETHVVPVARPVLWTARLLAGAR